MKRWASSAGAGSPVQPSQSEEDGTWSPVVELRRYALHPGTRETLIDLFDREFVESQEAVGIKVIGQFRDLDDPDSFVWLRGFRDMPSRAKALAAFYGGPVWARHREAANATMVAFDNVLLLRPASPGSGFSAVGIGRAPPGATDIPPGLVVATICHLARGAETAFADFFEHTLKPLLLAETSARILASFVTENSPNTFPRLPVREGETVFVWFSGFPDAGTYEDQMAALTGSKSWRGGVLPGLEGLNQRPNDVLRLAPTARSHLHG